MIYAKKSLGQHWLFDEASLKLIIDAAKLSAEDFVIEVGPGKGSLTKLIAERAKKVIAIETDHDLIPILQALKLGNVEIVEQDILQFNTAQLGDYRIVANIPYYLTSNLLRKLIESNNPPLSMTLLIQKEVAARINALPGQMSVLAFSVQYFATTELCGEVSRDKFVPMPKVDSTIINIVMRSKPYFAANTKKLFRLVKAGFGERRKQMKNSLAGGLRISQQDVTNLLERSGLNSFARAQELSLDEWGSLYRCAEELDLLN